MSIRCEDTAPFSITQLAVNLKMIASPRTDRPLPLASLRAHMRENVRGLLCMRACVEQLHVQEGVPVAGGAGEASRVTRDRLRVNTDACTYT